MTVYHPPLIGDEYQVVVGDFVAPASADPAVCTTSRHLSDDDSSTEKAITINAYFAQTAEWNPYLKGFHNDRRKQESLDKYLANVDTLYYKDPRHLAQDVALHFLHQCDYDMPLANRLLKPWQPLGAAKNEDTE